MTEFAYSEVLFAGDDGLPMQFNIQNTVEKDSLKGLIEYGGGMCTLSDEAIHVVTPGTKVLSVVSPKQLISSRYIYDCVKENCLLDIDEYQMQLNEMETSDFSDSSNLPEQQIILENNRKLSDDIIENSNDTAKPVNALTQNVLTCEKSNHDFDFEDSENVRVYDVNKEPGSSPVIIPLLYSGTRVQFCSVTEEEEKISKLHLNAMPDSLQDREQSENMEQNLLVNEPCDMEANELNFNGMNDDSIIPVVSSSQENESALDQFDNMILNKVREKPVENDDSLSQSYTVSSSADAQVSPKPPSHHTSAEIFNGSSAAPDSASQTTERQQYIKNLEKEIEQILKKPSPKSIQDKILLVKYICIAKKLAPAIVLQTLQKF